MLPSALKTNLGKAQADSTPKEVILQHIVKIATKQFFFFNLVQSIIW